MFIEKKQYPESSYHALNKLKGWRIFVEKKNICISVITIIQMEDHSVQRL